LLFLAAGWLVTVWSAVLSVNVPALLMLAFCLTLLFLACFRVIYTEAYTKIESDIRFRMFRRAYRRAAKH
jgi:hypothetical protein